MHSAMLRATPPGTCVTVPGTVPPALRGCPASGLACSKKSYELNSRALQKSCRVSLTPAQQDVREGLGQLRQELQPVRPSVTHKLSRLLPI